MLAQPAAFQTSLAECGAVLFVGIRIASGIAVIGAITGELYAGSSSSRPRRPGVLDSLRLVTTRNGLPFALVLAATALGFAVSFSLTSLEWYFLHRWHESARVPETD